jgi:hypothetical protein
LATDDADDLVPCLDVRVIRSTAPALLRWEIANQSTATYDAQQVAQLAGGEADPAG